MNAISAAYIAGLIDGEGTITLGRIHKGDNRQLVVSISSSELNLLRHVKDIIGVGKITNKKIYKDRHNQSYAYSLTNIQALELIKQISTYLHGYKRLRAELVLKHYKALTPRNGKYSPGLLEKRENFIKEFFSITAKPLSRC